MPGPASPILREFIRLLLAVGFLTRLPLPANLPWSVEEQARAARYFPLVGLLIGAGCAGVYALAAQLWPPTIAVLCAMAAGVWLTGALHEDGWADACDGLGGASTRERALEIMKDSRLGSFGAIGLLLMLLTKLHALTALAAAGPWQLGLALGTAHALSRLVPVLLIHALPYARPSGEAKSAAVSLGPGIHGLAVALLCGTLPLLAWPPATAIAMLVTTLLLTLAGARYLLRRLGGYTGDCLGAMQQLCELAVYLCALAAWNSI